jgi:hypothetical protein
MPIVYRVDHSTHLVVAAAHGVLTDEDVFGYQQGVWSRSEVAGYDELIDVTRVTEIALPTVDRVRDLATLSAKMDDTGAKSRLAVVAEADVAFGLGRMFQSYRQLDQRSTKEVAIFRTLKEALAFLRIEHPPKMPEVV